MSALTVSRIRGVLENQFNDLIDMSDWKGRPTVDIQSAFLSRAVAGLCIRRLANVDAETAAAAITDAFDDNGLDAIYFDQTNDTLHLVQTKWSEDGNRTISADSTGAFAVGVRDLLNVRFERFNAKIKAREAEIKAVLYAERPMQIVLTTAHTGLQAIHPFAKSKVDDLVEELNQSVPVARSQHYNQAGVYGLITAEAQPSKIKLQIGLSDWGVIEKPFLAYYGRVHIGEIAQWWRDHGNALFQSNLRLFSVSSDVNDALRKTLANDAESFWYFNNGITLICDTATKSLAGGTARTMGLFTCNGVSIVNGAQTVGTIGGSYLPPTRLRSSRRGACGPRSEACPSTGEAKSVGRRHRSSNCFDQR
jgi:AIPR protein